MFRRIVRTIGIPLFLAALFLAGGATSSPAYASHEATYVESVVHGANIDHITRLIENALSHPDGLSIHDADIVYGALGRTSTALDLLYSSGATGDVFNTAERLLQTQFALLEEVEHATLTGDLADLSTVAPLLVDVAQARLAFERQAASLHGRPLSLSRSHLGSSLLHDRSLLSRRHLSPTRSLSTLSHPTRSLSTLRHRSSSLTHPGRTSLSLRSQLFDHRDLLLSSRLSRLSIYR